MISPRDEQWLRDAFAAPGSGSAGTGACPTPDQLWAGARSELSPAEVQQLTDHLVGCDACAELWRTAMAFGPEVRAVRSTSPATWTGVLLPVAASLVLIAGGVFGARLLQERDSTELPRAAAGGRESDVRLPSQPVLELQVAAITVPAEYAIVWRGAGDGQGFLTALAGGLAPYRAGDYASAATRLTEVAREYPDLPEPAFYLGVAQLMLDRPADARTALARARQRASGARAREIEWYLAVADERAGQPAAALERLTAVRAQRRAWKVTGRAA